MIASQSDALGGASAFLWWGWAPLRRAVFRYSGRGLR